MAFATKYLLFSTVFLSVLNFVGLLGLAPSCHIRGSNIFLVGISWV